MLRKYAVGLSLFLAALLFLAVTAMLGAIPAAAQPTYTRIATIEVPGAPLTSFDISWVDEPTETYFLADRSNAAIDIINAENNTFVGRIPGFVGFRGSNPISGPNGVVVIHSEHKAWVGDGDSTVKVADLDTGTIVDTISTGGVKRADELAFDPRDHVLMVANPDEDIAFVTFISTSTHEVLGRIFFPDATDGIEQPVWDPETHRFLQAVPETTTNERGEIAVIDPRTMRVTDVFPVPEDVGICHPHGLALGPNQHLLLGCSDGGSLAKTVIMNARDGSILAVIRGKGGSDQVWFNSGDNRYYLAARNNPRGPALVVIDAETNTFVAQAETAPAAHSVAADRKNNHVFVPLTPIPACPSGCIGVYAASD